MNLITPDGGLLFWMVLIFGIVFFILAKWGFPIITGAVDARSKSIEEALRQADEARGQLSSLAQEQQEMIARTRAEQAGILKDAAKAREEILAKAKEDAAAQTADMIAKAHESIEREREEAMRDIRRQVALLSVEVAEKVIRKDLEASEEQLSLLERLAEESSGNDAAGRSSTKPQS